MSETFKERLALAIQYASELEGGFQPLAQRMTADVKHGFADAAIDRRTLAGLASEKDVSLKISQLVALDRLLRNSPSGGLAKLWKPPSLFDLMAQHRRVTFLLGSRGDHPGRRIDLSRWDVRSYRELVYDLYARGPGFEIGFEDIIFRGERAAREFSSGRVPKNERWFHLVNSEFSPSLICVGSSLANHAAEVLLARMMGVNAFSEWEHESPRPFAFCWPRGDYRGDQIQSAFKIDPSRFEAELEGLEGYSTGLAAGLNDPAALTSAVVVGNTIKTVIRKDVPTWNTYGIIAATREEGRVLCCVLGLTGPATFGASKLVANFVADLPIVADTTRTRRVAWSLVRVFVHNLEQGDPDYRPDHRRVLDSKFEGGVNWFPPG